MCLGVFEMILRLGEKWSDLTANCRRKIRVFLLNILCNWCIDGILFLNPWMGFFIKYLFAIEIIRHSNFYRDPVLLVRH